MRGGGKKKKRFERMLLVSRRAVQKRKDLWAVAFEQIEGWHPPAPWDVQLRDLVYHAKEKLSNNFRKNSLQRMNGPVQSE